MGAEGWNDLPAASPVLPSLSPFWMCSEPASKIGESHTNTRPEEGTCARPDTMQFWSVQVSLPPLHNYARQTTHPGFHEPAHPPPLNNYAHFPHATILNALPLLNNSDLPPLRSTTLISLHMLNNSACSLFLNPTRPPPHSTSWYARRGGSQNEGCMCWPQKWSVPIQQPIQHAYILSLKY